MKVPVKVSYNPLDPSVLQDPYPHYAQLREEAPVAWIEQMNGYAVSRYDDQITVLSDPGTYSSAKFWPVLLGEYDPVPEVQPMISLDPPAHLRIRKLANKAFIPKNIAHLDIKMREVANQLIDDILSRHGRQGEFDLVWEFNALFPVSVVADVLGVDLARRMDFKHWVDDLLSAGNRAAYDTERLAQIRKSSDDIRAYFEELCDRRAAAPGADLISSFILADVDGEHLSRSEVMNLAILLLIGGVETTTNLLGITFGLLNRHPAIERQVRGDLARIPALFQEVLRYDPPVQMVFRHTTRETTLAGVTVPENALMLLLLASGNRDASHFADPDVFDIDRAAENFMSFGAGPHFCLGNFLARKEAHLGLEVLFERFSSLESTATDIAWMDSYFARGPKALPVRFQAR